MPRIFDDVAECVETTLSRVGPDIVRSADCKARRPGTDRVQLGLEPRCHR
jgi:hypothetical protein